MKLITRQFGELEFEEKHVILFPEGIIGFENYQKFLLIDDVDSEPFRWLLPVDNGEISFPLLDPFLLKPDYSLNLQNHEDWSIFVIASLAGRIEDSVINLRSPVIINNATRTGHQLILNDDSLPVRYPLTLSADLSAGFLAEGAQPLT